MIRSISAAQFKACVLKLVEGLPKLDPAKRELFGERYDPSKYVECRLKLARNQTDCEPYILRRKEWPEYWPEGSKPARWPQAPKESIYRKGMTPREYWEALCKAEAGEFISRRATDVDGVYNARPRGYVTDDELRDRYTLEDPFTITDILGTRDLETALVQPYGGQFRFLETHLGFKGSFIRHFRVDPAQASKTYQTAREGKFLRVPYIVESKRIAQVTARYAIAWRGIRRYLDRENGIAGSELGIFDIASGELLAVRRGFAISGGATRSSTGIWWMSAERCPTDLGTPSRQFIYEVLRPVPGVNAEVHPVRK